MNKKLKKNLIFNITYQILILFLPLVTSSYLARIVGAEGIGRYSYSYSVSLYFTYFTLLGLNKYGNRTIASVQENKEERSKAFCEIFTMQVVCFSACIISYGVYLVLFAQDKRISLIQTLFVLSSLFDVNWFFFGIEAFDKTVIRNTIVKISTTILIFILIQVKEDIEKYTFIMACSYLVSQLVLWPYLRKYVVFKKVKWCDVKKHIKPNLVMFLPVIAVSIYKIMDKIMLGMMGSKAIVGYYENAEKIINVPIAVITALGTVMLPRVTAFISENKTEIISKYRDLAIDIVLCFSSAATFGIIAIADVFSVLMWGEDFVMSGTIMSYLATTLMFLGVGNVIRTQFLIPYKYDRIYVVSVFMGAVINIVVNILLIPLLGGVGAAIGTICAEIVVCGYQIWKIRNGIPIKHFFTTALYMGLAGIIMLCVLVHMPVLNSNVLTIIYKVLVGCIIYVVLVSPMLYNIVRRYRI